MHRARHLQDERLFDCYLAERGGEPSIRRSPSISPTAPPARAATPSSPRSWTPRRDGDAESRRRLHARAPPRPAAADPAPHRARRPAGPRHQLSRRTSGRAHRRRGGAARATRWIAAAAAAGLFVGVGRRRRLRVAARSPRGRRDRRRPRPRRIRDRAAAPSTRPPRRAPAAAAERGGRRRVPVRARDRARAAADPRTAGRSTRSRRTSRDQCAKLDADRSIDRPSSLMPSLIFRKGLDLSMPSPACWPTTITARSSIASRPTTSPTARAA